MQPDAAEIVTVFGLFHRPSWHAKAACRDVGHRRFFEAGTGDKARAICATCTAREPCLAAALEDESLSGIWGGTLAVERRQMRRDDSRCGTLAITGPTRG